MEIKLFVMFNDTIGGLEAKLYLLLFGLDLQNKGKK
jgi:hypothetical protein